MWVAFNLRVRVKKEWAEAERATKTCNILSSTNPWLISSQEFYLAACLPVVIGCHSDKVFKRSGCDTVTSQRSWGKKTYPYKFLLWGEHFDAFDNNWLTVSTVRTNRTHVFVWGYSTVKTMLAPGVGCQAQVCKSIAVRAWFFHFCSWYTVIQCSRTSLYIMDGSFWRLDIVISEDIVIKKGLEVRFACITYRPGPGKLRKS